MDSAQPLHAETERLSVKTCTKCKKEYPATPEYFPRHKHTKDGLQYVCKTCNREAARQWRLENPDRVRETKRKWRMEHRDEYRKIKRAYYQANLERKRKQAREDAKKHPERRRRACRKRRLNPQNRITDSVSVGIGLSLKNGKNGYHWEDLVGYTRNDLVSHLESQFIKGMTWDNYGKYGWHIDHIRPLSDFDFATTDDPAFREAWSLWNLQPLWGKDNMSKGARCEAPPLPLLPAGMK